MSASPAQILQSSEISFFFKLLDLRFIKICHENIEIILVDDGSSDGSGTACDDWMLRDSRIRCIHQKNAGAGMARNAGLRLSSGEYILFVDGDDEIAPDLCEKLLSELLKERADISYCGFLNVFRDKTVEIIPDDKVLKRREISFALVTEISIFTAVWNKLFRREVLLDSEGRFIEFSSDISVGEDGLWLSKVLKNVEKAAAVPQALYYWKRRENSATQGGAGGQMFEIEKSVQLPVVDETGKLSVFHYGVGMEQRVVVGVGTLLFYGPAFFRREGVGHELFGVCVVRMSRFYGN